MLVLTSIHWNLIDIGTGFPQLFKIVTWEVHHFPRLQGNILQNIYFIAIQIYILCISRVLDPYFSMYRNVIKRITYLSATRSFKKMSVWFPPWYVSRILLNSYSIFSFSLIWTADGIYWSQQITMHTCVCVFMKVDAYCKQVTANGNHLQNCPLESMEHSLIIIISGNYCFRKVVVPGSL